jgi:ribonuclease VapC
VIVDSSALVAILRNEPEAVPFAAALREASVRASAATVLETAMVMGPEMAARLDSLIEHLDLEIVPFDADQLSVARAAMGSYGRGRGHRARLNYGDCFSYALAKVTGEPLLFKGDDFTHTDVTPALSPDVS